MASKRDTGIMGSWKLGIIGGSGLYDIEGLTDRREEFIDTPWGQPSDSLVFGKLHGVELVFLPRHGKGHSISPSDINYRANIDVLKRVGCTDLLSVSACGSMKEDYAPGEFVVVDQFIDRTRNRVKSFFGSGCVGHVSMAYPVCERLAALVSESAKKAGITVHEGGSYLAMEGPQFSTLAESRLYRQWGCDVIGMTNMPEASLAREAELPYATVAMVTDYDCWHSDEEAVSVTNVLEVMHANVARARRMIEELAKLLSSLERTDSPQKIEYGLDYAIVTAPDSRDPELWNKLDAVAGRLY